MLPSEQRQQANKNSICDGGHQGVYFVYMIRFGTFMFCHKHVKQRLSCHCDITKVLLWVTQEMEQMFTDDVIS